MSMVGLSELRRWCPALSAHLLGVGGMRHGATYLPKWTGGGAER